jgi:hypothetical protein
VVVAFAYTTCVDVCPLITAALRQVQGKLSVDERKTSYLLTVTTDPDIDSPKVLAGYAKRYGAELDAWSFLTGSETALKSVWKNFGVGVKRKGRGLVDHTPLTADRRSPWSVAICLYWPISRCGGSSQRHSIAASRALAGVRICNSVQIRPLRMLVRRSVASAILEFELQPHECAIRFHLPRFFVLDGGVVSA